MLVSDLISGAMRLLNAVAAGEGPSTTELSDGLLVLQELVDSWNTEQLTIPQIVNVTQSLTTGTGVYSMGPSATINVPRPLKIESAGVVAPNGLRQPLEIVNSHKWAAIPEKTATAQLPIFLYNDNAYPQLTLHLWPVPNNSSGTSVLDLWLWNQLQAFVATTDTVAMPPGYLRALRYNLAVAIAAEYGAPVSPQIQAIAEESKQNLITLDASNALAKLPTDLPSPPPPGGGAPPPPQAG